MHQSIKCQNSLSPQSSEKRCFQSKWWIIKLPMIKWPSNYTWWFLAHISKNFGPKNFGYAQNGPIMLRFSSFKSIWIFSNWFKPMGIGSPFKSIWVHSVWVRLSLFEFVGVRRSLFESVRVSASPLESIQVRLSLFVSVRVCSSPFKSVENYSSPFEFA